MIGKITGTLYWAPQINDLVDTAGNYIFLDFNKPDEVTNASAMLDPDLGNAGEISLHGYATFRIVDKDQQDLKIIASLKDGTEVIETYDLKDLTCLGPYWFELSTVPSDIIFDRKGDDSVKIAMNDLIDFNASYVVDNDHGIITAKLLGEHFILPLAIHKSASTLVAMFVDEQLTSDYFDDVTVRYTLKDDLYTLLKNGEQVDASLVFGITKLDNFFFDYVNTSGFGGRFDRTTYVAMPLFRQHSDTTLNPNEFLSVAEHTSLVVAQLHSIEDGQLLNQIFSLESLKKYDLDLSL